MIHPIKLSTAIIAGRDAGVVHVRRVWFDAETRTACALGHALIGLGVVITPDRIRDHPCTTVWDSFPILHDRLPQPTPFPFVDSDLRRVRTIEAAIIALNDDYCWSLDEIIAWVVEREKEQELAETLQ